MVQPNSIRIFQTPEELTESTAKFIIDIAKQAIKIRRRFVISLSGGHTPERLYALLVQPPFREQISWDKTFIFWGDERCVPANDEQNNSHMAKTLLLDKVDIPSLNIKPIPVNLSPEDAAKEYEKTIKNFFGEALPCFDLMLLGLGENGHTASLFPGTDVVFDTTHLVTQVYVAEQKMFRITMTAKLINHAQNIVFLVEGDGKAKILNTVLTTAYEPAKYPAQLIKPVDGSLYWFVDNKAAALLPDQFKAG